MATHPYDLVIPCFANNAVVQPGVRLNALLVLRPIVILDVVASLYEMDHSPPDTYGVSATLKVGSTTLLSSPVRILPGNLNSKVAGTPQPVIAVPDIIAFTEIAPEVLAYGDGARGLCIYIIASFED
jgi:hypothetical protein